MNAARVWRKAHDLGVRHLLHSLPLQPSAAVYFTWHKGRSTTMPVSYTHLDVYKRQFLESAESLSDTVEVWDTEHRVLERARHEAQSAERAVEKALEASPFASEDAVLRAILEDRDAAELTAWHEKWTRDVARVEAELATQDMQRAARLSEEDLSLIHI